MAVLSLRLADDLHKLVTDLAHAQRTSVNQLIADLLAERVGVATPLQALIHAGRATAATARVSELPEPESWGSGPTVTDLRNDERN
jgi:predicted transcriptional regulator